MTAQYVIRRNAFFYTDEWYACEEEEGRVYQVFDSQEEAQTVMHGLNIQVLRNCEDLDNYGFFCGDMTKKQRKQLDAWLIKIGVKENHLPEFLQQQADDQTIGEFLDLSGLVFFNLIAVDNDEKFYVVEVWEDGKYWYLPTPDSDCFDHSDHSAIWFGYDDNFFSENMWHLGDMVLRFMPQGSLAELSDSPELLKQFFQNAKTIQYDETLGQIDWAENKPDWGELQALNALLKQPVFRVREADLAELSEV